MEWIEWHPWPRRFAEWKITERVIDLELESDDIIIRDGSLQTSHKNEYKYVEDVFRKAMEKDAIHYWFG